MVVEINNVKQQEQKRCKYCLGTGKVSKPLLISAFYRQKSSWCNWRIPSFFFRLQPFPLTYHSTYMVWVSFVSKVEILIVRVSMLIPRKLTYVLYFLLSGYLACARCSSTGALVLIEPVSTIKVGDKPLLPPKTERCSNCSGSGKVGHLEIRL